MNEKPGSNSAIDAPLTAILKQIDAARESGASDDEKKLARFCFDIGGTLAAADLIDDDLFALSSALKANHPRFFDFSAENLSAMTRFYRTYNGHAVLETLIDAISWPKHLAILDRCDNDRAQEFYIRMTRKFDWSEQILIKKIEDFRPPK